MDKVTGNYLTQSNKDFPLDCETLDYIAKNTAMVEMLGNIGGDKVILCGCELLNGGTVRSEGFVFLRTKDFPDGEVLRWEGGSNGNIYVKKEDITVVADNYSYPKAYTRRSLAPGLGNETFSWADFSNLKTNAELAKNVSDLESTIKNIVGEPLGVIKMWAGKVIPDGYLLCDGSAYEKTNSEYAGLYDAIGDVFNSALSCNGVEYVTETDFFRVPDLRGRFIVGHNSTDSEYNRYGLSGGEKKHLLTPNETALVKHGHDVTCSEAGTHNHHNGVEGFGNLYGGGDFLNKRGYQGGEYDFYSNSNTSSGGSHTHDIGLSDSEGKNALELHENRPPYYVLAYIMKYK